MTARHPSPTLLNPHHLRHRCQYYRPRCHHLFTTTTITIAHVLAFPSLRLRRPMLAPYNGCDFSDFVARDMDEIFELSLLYRWRLLRCQTRVTKIQ